MPKPRVTATVEKKQQKRDSAKTPGKKRGPAKGNGGRPRAEIPWGSINALCAMHTPAHEIIAFLAMADEPISRDTLDRRCKEEFGTTFAAYVEQRHDATAKPSLRKMQWKVAQSGNPAMLIWLGKQVLGQTDVSKSSVMHGFDADNPPPVRIVTDSGPLKHE